MFVDFSKPFDSIHREKMEQILLEYGFPIKTVSARIFYKNMKLIVCSLDGPTDFFDFVVGVLQWDTLAAFLFIICLWFHSKKGKMQIISSNNFDRCRLCW